MNILYSSAKSGTGAKEHAEGQNVLYVTFSPIFICMCVYMCVCVHWVIGMDQ